MTTESDKPDGMDAVHAYLRSLRARKAAQTTISTARTNLGTAERIIGKPLEVATHDDLRRWQEIRAAELSARTLRTQISSVRAFYAWAVLEGVIRVDPTTRLRTPRVAPALPRPIPENRLRQAWDAADDRTRAILALAAFAGLRACEIAGLDWSHVDLDDAMPHLRVTGKGGKERVVDVSPDLAAALTALPGRRGPVVRRHDGRPGPMTPNLVSKVANDHLRAVGIPDTLHALRHRMATELCRIAGPRRTAEVLGHANLSTVMVYTRVARDDVRPAVIQVGRFLDAS